MPDDSLRAFVALELDQAIRDALATLIGELRGRLQGLSWARPEDMHLTLRFLGRSRPAALEALKPPLRDAAARCPPATPVVSGLGLFPERGRARVLWIGIAIPPPVRALQSECEAVAVAAGFAAEARGFHPHLTLGRWRQDAPRPDLPRADLGPTPLHRLVLYRSDLGPAGARHTPLAGFSLGGGS